MRQQRHGQVLHVLARQERISVTELSSMLGVSEVTVRHDLDALAQAGLLRRTRGGAARVLETEQALEASSLRHVAAKRRIGRAAAALVRSGDTIFLDVGSTTTEIARSLSPTLQGVLVVTNGLNIALELERLPNVEVMVTGGRLRRLQHSLVNPYALELLGHIHADWLFLGCNGVHPERGVTNANFEEAEVKAGMVARSREVVVVADHSKLGAVSRAQITGLEQVTTLITDKQPGQFMTDYAAQVGRVLCV
ncbi:DeoR/GlpR family DNA-binding transcription regulator [Deinococcus sp.]|uniref:DeoR/GlpR family DNA-binding transcription regulator n=1 Tax=Deinococcus sp. TaxID=47478 RepID=UPI0025D37110|nr:DeoR/GlpR family DNA-binding transcription regulator [Deinococcus sp.]